MMMPEKRKIITPITREREITYPYRAIEIAYTMLNDSVERGIEGNTVILSQQLFLVQIISIIRLGKPAFLEEFEAWKSGPGISALSNQFIKDFTSTPYLGEQVPVLTEVDYNMDRDFNGFKRITKTPMDRKRIDADTLEIIADVLDNSLPFTLMGLLKLTKKEVPFNELPNKKKITNERLMEYYSGYDEEKLWKAVPAK